MLAGADQPTPEVGWTPTSLRPDRKISQSDASDPSSSDTNGHRSTSRKNARVAAASSE